MDKTGDTAASSFLSNNLLSEEDWGDFMMMEKLSALEDMVDSTSYETFHQDGQSMEYADDIDDLLQQITAGDSGNGSSSDEVITAVEHVKKELAFPVTRACTQVHLLPHTPAEEVKLDSPPPTPPHLMERAPGQPFFVADSTPPQSIVVNPQPVKIEPVSPPAAPMLFTQSPALMYQTAPMHYVQSNMGLQNIMGGEPRSILHHPPLVKEERFAPMDHSVHTCMSANHSTAPSTNISHHMSISEMRIIKKQQRMIKNRESATLSRKKKKEYMEHLESVVQKLTTDNERLRNENAKLQSTVSVLQNQIQMLYKRSHLSNKSKTVILMFFAFFALSISPFNSIFSKSSSVDNGQLELSQWTASVSSRTLLSRNEVVPDDVVHTSKSDQNWDSWDHNINSFYEAIFGSKRKHSNFHDKFYDETALLCPAMNRSESDRVAEDLNGWVQRYEGQRTSKKTRLRESVKKSRMKTDKTERKKQRTGQQEKKHQPTHSDIPTGSDLLLYNNWEDWFFKFMTYFNRRDDTFYIVSFDKDHVLLPALTHNKWQRPRMSLLMPALNVNDSSSNMTLDQLSMMQIDCEVYNTHFVQWEQIDNNSSDYGEENGGSSDRNESFWKPHSATTVEVSQPDQAHIWTGPKNNFLDWPNDVSTGDDEDLEMEVKISEEPLPEESSEGQTTDDNDDSDSNKLVLKREIRIATNRKERKKLLGEQTVKQSVDGGKQSDVTASSSRLRFYYGKHWIGKDTTESEK